MKKSRVPFVAVLILIVIALSIALTNNRSRDPERINPKKEQGESRRPGREVTGPPSDHPGRKPALTAGQAG